MSNDKKILILDDEEKWTQIIRNILFGQGYRLVDIKNCVLAFSDIIKDYDLAIIDIKMPKYTGFQIKNYLKLRSPNTKIILISQYEDFGLNLLNEANGADGWIEKKDILANEMDFILLIEDLLKTTHKDNKKENSFTLPGEVISNQLNQYGIRTVDQVKITEQLISLKKNIFNSNLSNRKDILLDIDQISLEFSKNVKSDATILEKLNEIRSTVISEKPDQYEAIIFNIEVILKCIFGELGPAIFTPQQMKEPSNKGETKIEINPQFHIKSDMYSMINIQLDKEISELKDSFSQLIDIIAASLPYKKEELTQMNNDLDKLSKKQDFKEKDIKTFSPIKDFLMNLGDDKSEISTIIKGSSKGVDLIKKMIHAYNKIATYLPIGSLSHLIF